MFRFEIRLWSSHSYGAWAWHPGSFTHTWAQIESTVNGMFPKRAVTHYEYTRTIPEIYQNDTGRGRSRMYATWEVRGEGLYWLRELRERHAATMAISLNHTQNKQWNSWTGPQHSPAKHTTILDAGKASLDMRWIMASRKYKSVTAYHTAQLQNRYMQSTSKQYTSTTVDRNSTNV